MAPTSTEESTDGQHSATDSVSRRTFLQTSTAAAVAAGGVGLASSSASAQWFGGGAGDIPELDTREGVPSASDVPDDDDVVFNVHGYTGSSASVSQAEQFASTAESVGYDGSVAAVTWDDSGGPIAAEQQAREAGSTLATLIENYLDQNPNTNIRVLGHSMGGFVTMEMVAALGEYRIENADMIGSYEEASAPCDGNFYSAIENNVAFMGNYHSSNDSIARLGQDGADCGGGLFGGGGSTPSNYQDVDVTGSVSGHTAYKSSTGCVEQIVSNYGDEISRGGSGGTSGTSGSSGSSSGSGSGWFGSGGSSGSDGGLGWF